MPHALFTQLHAAEADPVELLEFLQSHFGAAQMDPTGGVFYPRQEGARLQLVVKKDRVSDVRPGPNFDGAEVSELARGIEEKLLSPGVTVVNTVILFTRRPVLGHFSSLDHSVQLLPPPPEAPRPPHLLADHPLVFQYRFSGSTDTGISNVRGSRALAEWLWFLNSVIYDGIQSMRRRSRQLWAVCPDWEASERFDTTARWCQELYSIPRWKVPAQFVSIERDAVPIPLVPAVEYYGRRGRRIDDIFDLPDSFTADLIRLRRLPPEDRERFLRAGQWLMAARDLWDSHITSWYIALVAAIETLAHVERPRDDCAECGRDKNQHPTADFKDFVEEFAPGATRQEIDALYRVRSGLVHGRALLHHDSPFGSGTMAFASNEYEPLDRLARAVRLALLNWLRSRPTAPTSEPMA